MKRTSYDLDREARSAKEQIDVQTTPVADDLLNALLEQAWPTEESQSQ